MQTDSARTPTSCIQFARLGRKTSSEFIVQNKDQLKVADTVKGLLEVTKIKSWTASRTSSMTIKIKNE